MNLAHMRLQYEILNTPIEQLAAENSLPVNMLQEEVAKQNWNAWWPEPDLVLTPEVDGSEILLAQSEVFLDRIKRRLAVYNVAKEVLLSQKYYELENKILDTAIDTLAAASDLRAGDIHALGMLYKNLMSKSVSNTLVDMTFGEDTGGLPTVIIRDLSGRTKQVTT